jgi:hypothetical protein
MFEILTSAPRAAFLKEAMSALLTTLDGDRDDLM